MFRVNSTLPAPMIAIFAMPAVCQRSPEGVDRQTSSDVRGCASRSGRPPVASGAMPSFILAFDHRNSLMTSFFGVSGEPSDQEVAAAGEVKRTIADGLLAAIGRGLVGSDEAGALVDATYGVEAIAALQAADVRLAVPVETSGRREFAFEHSDWRERLDSLHPTWAKVLVRYNPDGDASLNERQRER